MTASQKRRPASGRGVRTSEGEAGARRAGSRAARRPAPEALSSRNARKTALAATPLAGLQAELGGLRTALDEILARVRSRMVARLERLAPAAAGAPARAATLVEDMRDEIKCAGIDPRKGRMKDLVRLKGLLDTLCGDLPGDDR